MKHLKHLFLLIGVAILLVSCNQIKSDAKAYIQAEEDYVKYVMETVEDDNLTTEEMDEIEIKYKKLLDKWIALADKYGDYDEDNEFWSEVDNLATEYSEDKLDDWMESNDDISDGTWEKWYDLIERLDNKYL
ncbi:MAG: hypothetical protein PHY08_09775 [Candidatus Cloacimonetes bacterium]|nr:hypothetical protein [Candidatus Cloacimonadota bacterium]